MSAKAERIVSTNKTGTQEVIVNFQPENLKAPFSLRCGALIIDYIIFIGIPVASLLIGRMLGDDGRKLLDSQLNNAGWLIAFIILLSNFIIFPMMTGQTIGKMLTGLRIVNKDGTSVSISRLCIRHLIGYPLTLLTLGLGFLFSAFNSKGRALHDYLAGTIVIYGKRKVK